MDVQSKLHVRRGFARPEKIKSQNLALKSGVFLRPEIHVTLTDDQLDVIAEKTAERMISAKRAQWIDPETHHEHHEWVKTRITDAEHWREAKRRIALSACIWAVPIIIGFIAVSVWRQIVSAAVGHPTP